jgi:hypothetical protein
VVAFLKATGKAEAMIEATFPAQLTSAVKGMKGSRGSVARKQALNPVPRCQVFTRALDEQLARNPGLTIVFWIFWLGRQVADDRFFGFGITAGHDSP